MPPNIESLEVLPQSQSCCAVPKGEGGGGFSYQLTIWLPVYDTLKGTVFRPNLISEQVYILFERSGKGCSFCNESVDHCALK